MSATNPVVQQSQRGLMVVVSGPAGVGKDTLLERIQSAWPRLKRVVTYTTRPPAEGERHGVDYLFVKEEEFKQLVQESAFLEHAVVHGNHYGTPRREAEAFREAGDDAALKIDVQGGLQIKEKNPDAVLMFIQPPDMGELEARMRKRGRDSEETIQLRLKNAWDEMAKIPFYDYLVTNDDIQRAVDAMRSILVAEKSRISRMKL